MDMSLKRKLSEIDGSSSKKQRQLVEEDPNKIRIGSRKSQLALIQTHTIMDRLRADHPNLEMELETMDTLGDQILHIALPKIGEKSLFTKDLEIALEAKRVDFLVHSLKDLPTTMPEGMALGTVYKRDDPHDCVVFNSKHQGKQLKDLPDQSVIGTSSLRRVAQLKKSHPNLQFKSIRGNLNTRFRKLEEDSYDALILAKAGLDRMGWSDRCGQVLLEEDCLYAIGQGAMAVEIRSDDKRTTHLLGELSDMKTLLTVAAERAFMRTLNGGCSTPIGCYAKFNNGKLSLRGNVLSTDGKQCVDTTVEDNIKYEIERTNTTAEKSYHMSNYGVLIDDLYKDELTKAEALGDLLAAKLIERGANEILREVRAQLPQVSNIHIPSSSTITF